MSRPHSVPEYVAKKSSIVYENDRRTFLNLDEGQFRFALTLHSYPYIKAFSSYLNSDAVEAMCCFETMFHSPKDKNHEVYDNNDDNISEFPSISVSQLPKSIWEKYAKIFRPFMRKDRLRCYWRPFNLSSRNGLITSIDRQVRSNICVKFIKKDYESTEDRSLPGLDEKMLLTLRAIILARKPLGQTSSLDDRRGSSNGQLPMEKFSTHGGRKPDSEPPIFSNHDTRDSFPTFADLVQKQFLTMDVKSTISIYKPLIDAALHQCRCLTNIMMTWRGRAREGESSCGLDRREMTISNQNSCINDIITSFSVTKINDNRDREIAVTSGANNNPSLIQNKTGDKSPKPRFVPSALRKSKMNQALHSGNVGNSVTSVQMTNEYLADAKKDCTTNLKTPLAPQLNPAISNGVFPPPPQSEALPYSFLQYDSTGRCRTPYDWYLIRLAGLNWRRGSTPVVHAEVPIEALISLMAEVPPIDILEQMALFQYQDRTWLGLDSILEDLCSNSSALTMLAEIQKADCGNSERWFRLPDEFQIMPIGIVYGSRHAPILYIAPNDSRGNDLLSLNECSRLINLFSRWDVIDKCEEKFEDEASRFLSFHSQTLFHKEKGASRGAGNEGGNGKEAIKDEEGGEKRVMEDGDVGCKPRSDDKEKKAKDIRPQSFEIHGAIRGGEVEGTNKFRKLVMRMGYDIRLIPYLGNV
eukprot:CAMPEP_0175068108 /NCGR_PEP_ID=MMETSP0052_2-20121109/17488_1 /TAXON_ID=51329 ORGANISM="Polytomella parva, Strain SAG 63-3" /NCGR_SAMPLE_ID=MMETSP0052_2 /ASSEMBLY_ACC=CAM_ASM_000194 /LENGTH=695 /DNA_ID=CAMNT_0016335099 /DNA_START=38 /DNA_END=2125 /DNA_ORIENTATION=-